MEIISRKYWESWRCAWCVSRTTRLYFLFSVYRKEEVPIWNYQAIHVYGTASILEIDELIEELAMMLKKYEENRENIVLWDELFPQLLERELKGIVGFKIKVQEVQAAYNLSQNRKEKDYSNIVDKLRAEKNPDSQ